MTNKNRLTALALCLLASLTKLDSAKLFAQDSSTPQLALNDNYLTLELTRNQPISDSQKEFVSGEATTFFGFRHTLRDRWLMGVHGGFKHFRKRDSGEELTMLTIAQESLYVLRLYHPVYAVCGPKLLYLLPTIGQKFPIARDNDFGREIGIALSLSLYYVLNKDFMFNARLDRWRGINREVFQGIETGFGINYALP